MCVICTCFYFCYLQNILTYTLYCLLQVYYSQKIPILVSLKHKVKMVSNNFFAWNYSQIFLKNSISIPLFLLNNRSYREFDSMLVWIIYNMYYFFDFSHFPILFLVSWEREKVSWKKLKSFFSHIYTGRRLENLLAKTLCKQQKLGF